MISPIELAYPIEHIWASMTVYAVHDHHNVHFMSLVYHVLQVIRCARSARRSKEVSHMISKWGIVWVLLHCHKLHAVVPGVLDTWENVICEFAIGCYFAFLRALNKKILIHSQQWNLGESLIMRRCYLPCQRVLHRYARFKGQWVCLISIGKTQEDSKIHLHTKEFEYFILKTWSKLASYLLFHHLTWWYMPWTYYCALFIVFHLCS